MKVLGISLTTIVIVLVVAVVVKVYGSKIPLLNTLASQ